MSHNQKEKTMKVMTLSVVLALLAMPALANSSFTYEVNGLSGVGLWGEWLVVTNDDGGFGTFTYVTYADPDHTVAVTSVSASAPPSVKFSVNENIFSGNWSGSKFKVEFTDFANKQFLFEFMIGHVHDDGSAIVISGQLLPFEDFPFLHETFVGSDKTIAIRDWNQYEVVTMTVTLPITGWTFPEEVPGISMQITGSYHNDVPEPATMSLLALGGLALLKRRRSR